MNNEVIREGDDEKVQHGMRGEGTEDPSSSAFREKLPI